jgi:UDP-galactopyranose mutase
MFGNNYPVTQPDLVCFSHLRWDFVYQRPQHLLKRCARERRVFFVEEPVLGNSSMRLELNEREAGVRVVVPHLPEGLRSEIATTAVLKGMIRRLLADNGLREYVFWYYTPMALKFTDHLNPIVSIYDCMDELSAFAGAHSLLQEYERALFERVDLVFTGGQSLYEAKRDQHGAVYAFPSSIEVSHFQQARSLTCAPKDQESIPHPRLGFFGVIDERLDIRLLNNLAAERPDWHFVMIGPVVKIDRASLPRRPNIHYLGGKQYEELPAYIAGWDIAMLLFARNAATRFISPTKTPEYLAAGKPVISTSIRDVVRPYGELDLVRIADTAPDFVRAAEELLTKSQEKSDWLARVDEFLAEMSWDKTWAQMWNLIDNAIAERRAGESTVPQVTPLKRTVAATAVAAR